MCLAVPGKITEIHDSDGIRMGTVDFGGVRQEVCLQAVPEAQVGQYVIVHVGFALNVLDEEEARETLDLLRQMEDAGRSEGASE
ncbi:MAG: HypC/HybG/HupF family hydrogenase formation chaperone [Candidatus Eisenbacteria bacterium]|nr:HypC/HybG/HupF family hydrogenase formation chaperone [Candidatus Latescibacterota bacterium]MBD3300834.1 HypC/HybG/HupF family hydrogenase formation chaperone [Candidatus Eisenbacteria bacterium]